MHSGYVMCRDCLRVNAIIWIRLEGEGGSLNEGGVESKDRMGDLNTEFNAIVVVGQCYR